MEFILNGVYHRFVDCDMIMCYLGGEIGHTFLCGLVNIANVFHFFFKSENREGTAEQEGGFGNWDGIDGVDVEKLVTMPKNAQIEGKDELNINKNGDNIDDEDSENKDSEDEDEDNENDNEYIMNWLLLL